VVTTLPILELGDGDEPTALYRLFSPDMLLYVGISDNPIARFKQHAKKQAWWPEVTRKTIQWYPSRDDAAEAELAAIRDELPKFNVAGSPSPLRRPAPLGVPFLAVGEVLTDPEDILDYIRSLIGSSHHFAEVILRMMAAAECGGRLPRGSALRDLSEKCGVSLSQAYRILALQDAADRAAS
jgi:hypothetical protein